MIKNKGQHEHEYYTRCECTKCVCDRYPHDRVCYFCEEGKHDGHKCVDHIYEKNNKFICEACQITWMKVNEDG
jgi:hypothetical protein